jgi:hypothetical protein
MEFIPGREGEKGEKGEKELLMLWLLVLQQPGKHAIGEAAGLAAALAVAAARQNSL